MSKQKDDHSSSAECSSEPKRDNRQRALQRWNENRRQNIALGVWPPPKNGIGKTISISCYYVTFYCHAIWSSLFCLLIKFVYYWTIVSLVAGSKLIIFILQFLIHSKLRSPTRSFRDIVQKRSGMMFFTKTSYVCSKLTQSHIFLANIVFIGFWTRWASLVTEKRSSFSETEIPHFYFQFLQKGHSKQTLGSHKH